jgi:hypothetical protein
MFLHAFNTWFLANLLHPLMMLAGMIATHEHHNNIFSTESFSILVLGFIFSIFCSLPSLFLSWWLLQIIVSACDTMLEKVIAWLLITALLIVLEVLVIRLIINDQIEIRGLLLSLPAIAATWIAIGIRWKQFMNLSYQHTVSNDENNPVKTSE